MIIEILSDLYRFAFDKHQEYLRLNKKNDTLNNVNVIKDVYIYLIDKVSINGNYTHLCKSE